MTRLQYDDVMRAAILNWSPVPSIALESGQTPVAGRPGAAPAQLQAVTCGGSSQLPTIGVHRQPHLSSCHRDLAHPHYVNMETPSVIET